MLRPGKELKPLLIGEPRPVLAANGGLGFGSSGSSLFKELMTCCDDEVDPWDEVSLSSGSVKGLSDLRDLRRKSCGCDGDCPICERGEFSARSTVLCVTVLELLGVVGL